MPSFCKIIQPDWIIFCQDFRQKRWVSFCLLLCVLPTLCGRSQWPFSLWNRVCGGVSCSKVDTFFSYYYSFLSLIFWGAKIHFFSFQLPSFEKIFSFFLFGRSGAAMEASASRRCRDVARNVSTTLCRFLPYAAPSGCSLQCFLASYPKGRIAYALMPKNISASIPNASMQRKESPNDSIWPHRHKYIIVHIILLLILINI